VRERISDMNAYLDTDSLRRQASTVVKLTVVTIVGLIGTVATGFLGMNLIAEADSPLARRLLYLVIVLAGATSLTLYTVIKSKRMSDFLDALSDERLPAKMKFKALLDVWRTRAGD
jgi:Mg2+ and Co2+ transporter CorA